MADENLRIYSDLIIIGNGFNLQCGLKSSYSDFFKWKYINGKTFTNKEHGRNLLHKLTLENRLKIKEISPSDETIKGNAK